MQCEHIILGMSNFDVGRYYIICKKLQGDFGGPLECDNGEDKWYLKGVFSKRLTGVCSTKIPGVFTNVPSFYDWILEAMEKLESIELWNQHDINFTIKIYTNM